MIGLLIKSEDIDLYKWEFEYKSRRREMTEDERIKEDLEMELHIKTENDKMINKIMKTINFYQNMHKKYYRIKEDSMETV
jgi:hypothetical protein